MQLKFTLFREQVFFFFLHDFREPVELPAPKTFCRAVGNAEVFVITGARPVFTQQSRKVGNTIGGKMTPKDVSLGSVLLIPDTEDSLHYPQSAG